MHVYVCFPFIEKIQAGLTEICEMNTVGDKASPPLSVACTEGISHFTSACQTRRISHNTTASVKTLEINPVRERQELS